MIDDSLSRILDHFRTVVDGDKVTIIADVVSYAFEVDAWATADLKDTVTRPEGEMVDGCLAQWFEIALT